MTQTTAEPRSVTLAVQLAGVRKTFGEVSAVRGIDLKLNPGEVVAFLGPNGAGKTTTIDMILGLSQPTQGDISVFGMRPRDAVAHGLVSAVMQTGGLLKDLTVRETLTYTASLFAHSRAVDDVLADAGISAIANRKVAKCSGGEQQRLRFAMALLSDPALIVLDEPTTGMDVEGRRTFWSAIRADADRGRTVRATWPGADAEALSRLGGVDHVELRGDTVLVHARDTDVVARYLLTSTPAHDLEITARGLEEAFLALTASKGSDR